MVAIHGRSFATAAVTENLVLAYPEAVPGSFNIEMLHTALAGRQSHASYALCGVRGPEGQAIRLLVPRTRPRVRGRADPYVVFPGNIQGRTIRETRPKRAVAVTVEDDAVVAVERIELDVLRCAVVDVDCTGAAASDASDLLFAAGSGLTGVSNELAALEAEADGIWGPRATARRSFTQAQRELAESQRAARDQTLKPRTWLDARSRPTSDRKASTIISQLSKSGPSQLPLRSTPALRALSRGVLPPCDLRSSALWR
ncbi:AAA family ATPase [Enterovirga rhinocerotis]|uniref:AAA family ATPase n=1 Tax=Enterovirga rhinocerotis TaxID=1339210 RepID=UPI001AACA6FC|nr:AAA family ATPase [Enterovirga rhinocerotis]